MNALIELGDDGVGGPIAFVLDRLHLLDAHAKVARVLEDAAQQFRACPIFADVGQFCDHGSTSVSSHAGRSHEG